jgi:hydrogenase-4 component H
MRKPKLRELKEAVLAVIRGPYTTKYPFEPHEPPDGFRGRSEFQEDGCIGCRACAEVCPAVAIKVVDDVDVDPPKRTLTIHHDKCIFCGQCELYCTTGDGVKLTKVYDMATLDRSSLRNSIEHDLVMCEVCDEIVGAVKHLRWVAERLGAKAYANPTLIVAADGAVRLAPRDSGRPGAPLLARSDMMRVMCPKCRRTTVIHEFWGE